MTAQEKTALETEVEKELLRWRGYTLPLQLDLTSLLALAGSLTLALRHPGHTGPSAGIVLRVVKLIADRLASDGLPAHARIIREGLDPANDEPRGPFGGPRDVGIGRLTVPFDMGDLMYTRWREATTPREIVQRELVQDGEIVKLACGHELRRCVMVPGAIVCPLCIQEWLEAMLL